MTDQQRELLQRVGREAVQASGEFLLPLHLDLTTCLSLCGSLQLALRHPGNTGPSARVARATIDALIQGMRENGYLATAELAQMGDSPELDEAPERVRGAGQ